jgi:hypothetical protein
MLISYALSAVCFELFTLPAISVFNAKGWKQAGGIKVDFLDVLNCRKARAGSQLVFESFHIRRRTLGEGFDPPIIKVLHIADHLMTRRRSLGEEAKPYALYVASDEELARYFSNH